MSTIKVRYAGGVLRKLDAETGSPIPTVIRNETIHFDVSSNVWAHFKSIRLSNFRAWEGPPGFKSKNAKDWTGVSVVLAKGSSNTLDLPTKYSSSKHRMITMDLEEFPKRGTSKKYPDPWDEAPG